MKDYKLFKKLILFTVEGYLTKAMEEGLTQEPLHKDLVSGIRSYMTFGRLSPDEAKILIELGNDEYMEKIKKIEIAFVIFAMELMRLYVTEIPREERKGIYLGVSNKKLLHGRAYFAKTMLVMKQTNPEVYKEKREIIDDSVLTAKKFFGYTFDKLVKEKR